MWTSSHCFRNHCLNCFKNILSSFLWFELDLFLEAFWEDFLEACLHTYILREFFWTYFFPFHLNSLALRFIAEFLAFTKELNLRRVELFIKCLFFYVCIKNYLSHDESRLDFKNSMQVARTSGLSKADSFERSLLSQYKILTGRRGWIMLNATPRSISTALLLVKMTEEWRCLDTILFFFFRNV